MHEMLAILTDVRGVCLSVCLSAARAVYGVCRVRGVIRCRLRQMSMAFVIIYKTYLYLHS